VGRKMGSRVLAIEFKKQKQNKIRGKL